MTEAKRLVTTDALLRVVQYIGVHDSVGAGLVIEPEWVGLLASLGGSIDIDQYVVETETTEHHQQGGW